MGTFDELYAKHAAAVFRYASKCVGRRDVAEDITSEAFLALYRHRSAIDETRLPGWLFAVVKNRALNYWRRVDVEQRYLSLLPSGEPDPPPQPSLELWLAETKALKPVHRACIILRYVHGHDRASIAEQLGLTENQVKGHLQYALTILRRELERMPS